MAILKKGSFSGKTDRMGNEILIGDTVKKLGYGTQFIVNKYGGLNDGDIPILSVKNWRGEDYEVIISMDSPDKVEEVTEAQEQQTEKSEAAKIQQFNADKDKIIAELRKKLKETEDKLEQKYEELGQACDCVSDMQKEMEDLKDELKTKHTILEDMQKTIDSLNSSALSLQEERDSANRSNETLSATVTNLTEQLNEALTRQTSENKPLSAYTSSELMAEIKGRGREFLEYVTNDELSAELRERGFKGELIRSYQVTMHETMDV